MTLPAHLLPRPIAGVGADIPIWRVDALGNAAPFGRMVPVSGGRFWVDEADGLSQLHDGLPWFLNDMRPQGFMGRTFAHGHPELQLPGDLRHWSDDHTLKAMVQAGDDLPGNLVVGQPALERFQTLAHRQHRVRVPEAEYPALAEQALLGTLPGSSAGGEQPKFCTTLAAPSSQSPTAEVAVIVKFSPAGQSPADQRLRDLLVCEHLALHTLAQAGLPAAQTRIVQAAGRVFLEAVRFDRTAQGRVGMVSLLVYDSEYVGQMDNWAATSQRMAQLRLLTATDAQQLRLLDAYGQLIANTDRHYGNISLLLHNDNWQLSPTYDMLPMLYAPIHGELPHDGKTASTTPSDHTQAEWPHALALAQRFWQTVVADGRVSAAFKAMAQANLGVVQAAVQAAGNPPFALA